MIFCADLCRFMREKTVREEIHSVASIFKFVGHEVTTGF